VAVWNDPEVVTAELARVLGAMWVSRGTVDGRSPFAGVLDHPATTGASAA